MADYYRKIVNTLLISGAEKNAQRQKVYDKARAQAQEDIKQADSTEKAAEISAAIEDAIRRAELRFAAEEKNKTAAAAMPVVRIINYKSIAKKTSSLLILLAIILITIGVLYTNPSYLAKVKTLATSYLVPTIPTEKVTDNTQSHAPEQNAQVQSTKDNSVTENEIQQLIKEEAIDKKTKNNITTNKTQKPPSTKTETPVKNRETHIEASEVVATSDNFLSYDAVKQCAKDYLFIDKQWENLDTLNKTMQNKSAEINQLQQQKEHRLVIASAQAEYNKLVKRYNNMVDTLNDDSAQLNSRCADKSIDYDDLARICQKGSPYHSTSFCTSMM